MKPIESLAPLGLFSTLLVAFGLVAAGALALPGEAHAAASPCDDKTALQRRLDAFDDRWNASDAWGLTAQFAMDGSLSATAEPGRQAVYRELIERLGRSAQQRQTHLLRATRVGPACLVDVEVRSGARSEAGLFLLSPGEDGGILAMR